jgi:hypothetical protein
VNKYNNINFILFSLYLGGFPTKTNALMNLIKLTTGPLEALSLRMDKVRFGHLHHSLVTLIFINSSLGSCVDVPLADGGHAYYTYSTSKQAPAVPKNWSKFYAIEHYYDNQTTCEAAKPNTVELISIQNSASCIFMVFIPSPSLPCSSLIVAYRELVQRDTSINA